MNRVSTIIKCSMHTPYGTLGIPVVDVIKLFLEEI